MKSSPPNTLRAEAILRPLLVISVFIGLSGVLFFLGTSGSPGGLGIEGAQTVKVERDRNWRITKYSIDKSDGKTVWDWLQLVIVPASLAGFGLWFQQQQRRRDAEDKVELRENTAVKEFIQSMQPLLLDKRLKQSPVDAEVRGVARALTLATLSQMESKESPARKELVIRFLLDSGLNNESGNLFSLSRADLSGANLSMADLSGANLCMAKLSGANLLFANLSKADLRVANLSGSELLQANLSGANLGSAELREARLGGANLSGANLGSADLREAHLGGADLSEADLGSADLSMTFLSTANFSRANLSMADLSGANLSRADLSGVKLSLADLSRANLRNANLSGADLDCASLNGADLDSITWDEETNWPPKQYFKGAKNTPPDLKKQLDLD